MQLSMYRQALDYWNTSRMIDLFHVSAIGADIVENDRKSYVNTMDEGRKNIIEMLDPFGPKDEWQKAKAEQEEKKARDDDASNKIGVLSALASCGTFGDLSQINAALEALDQTIEEIRHADTTANKPDTGQPVPAADAASSDG